MDRSEIHVGQVVFFTKVGIKRYGKCLSGVPLTVVEVEPEWYKGSMDVHISFALPSDYDMRTLWIHSSCVMPANNEVDVSSLKAITDFLSEF